MCGIVGFSGVFDSTALRTGLSRIARRGPDDRGVFLDEQAAIGLGHTRLAILDLSQLGHQPMAGADGAVVLVFNGEIYNYRELRSELESKGYRFRGQSDAEVQGKLYLAEGETVLSRLNGVFAFAPWDRRNRRLFIGRDAAGVKPQYSAATPRDVAFE